MSSPVPGGTSNNNSGAALDSQSASRHGPVRDRTEGPICQDRHLRTATVSGCSGHSKQQSANCR